MIQVILGAVALSAAGVLAYAARKPDTFHVGPSKFITKLMQCVMNMDKMIGKDFADGPAKMKAAVEK